MALGRWMFLLKYIWPPSVFSGVIALFKEWRSSEVKNKAILTAFFVPAIFSVLGLVVYVAYFILFQLPAFVLGVLGWLLLISLFSGGGLFCYEKISGKRDTRDTTSDSTSYDYDVAPDWEIGKGKKNWFNDIKWGKK